MNKIKMLTEISNKVYNSFKKEVYNLEKISNIHKKEKDEIVELYEKVKRLKYHTIMLDEQGKQVLIITLCKEGLGIYNRMIKNCIYKIV